MGNPLINKILIFLLNPQKKYNHFLKCLHAKLHSDVSSLYSHNKQLYLPNALGLITFRHLSPSIYETMSSMHASLHKAIPQLPLYNASTHLLFTYSDYYQVTVRNSSYLCLEIKRGSPLQLMGFMCNFAVLLVP
jgi:hypothetical protein